jgi:hypothetical protein
MPTPLEEWQGRLERHFTQLASARSMSGFPLFALEHGLSKDETREIGKLLHVSLAEDPWLASQWLVWVVYATELGYDYYGDEYWPSFEEHTPLWRVKGSRSNLRTWFCKFQITYKGVTPSGQWADWFTIISWPITHSILPRYLQGQLAKALFDLRYRLVGLKDLSPRAVGQFLSTNAWEGSSRFREFLQQEELVGRIVLALLSEKEVEGKSPIYPPTLQRIVSDLEVVQSAREWLKETRSYVADRFKGAGHNPGERSLGLGGRLDHANDSADAQPSIRPNLMLRRSGESSWSVVIEIPSFVGVSGQYPELRAFLKLTRCKIAGTGGNWLPAGWLLSSAQRRVVRSWPGAGTPLVRFEQRNGQLDHLVDNETRLSAGPVWLFRLGKDGLAREILGRIARPGGEYIILSETNLPSGYPTLVECGLDCEGLSAAVLSMPRTISSDMSKWLHDLGIHVARTVRIWPAGLVGRNWDGEGYGEWLTTESPCFGIVHDHPLDGYILQLNGGPETLIKADEVGSPVFVKLSRLPVGSHTLSVKIRRGYYASSATPYVPPLEGIVTLEVREPEPWVPGTTSYAGLAISIDPQEPSLDTFWDGHVEVNILGPIGRQVSLSVSLANAAGKELLSEQIGTFELPVLTGEWQKKLSQFVNNERRAWTYPEALSGQFRIRGEELGEFALRLEREAKPIRWVCRYRQQAMTVRLIDDTGASDEAICRFFSLRRPTEPTRLNTKNLLAGFQVPPPGGLFEAENGQFSDAMIVSTPRIQGGLQGLAIEPELHELEDVSIQTTDVLKLLRLWYEARQAGPLVKMRQDLIVNRLLNQLYSRLCGKKWAQAETAYFSNPNPASSLLELQRLVGWVPGFATDLSREFGRMESGTDIGTQWFVEVAARYQVCSDQGLCEFALQLASRPHRLVLIPASVLNELLIEIKKNSALMRGARLLALLALYNTHDFTRFALPGWKW